MGNVTITDIVINTVQLHILDRKCCRQGACDSAGVEEGDSTEDGI